jgi:HEAT repeat protein
LSLIIRVREFEECVVAQQEVGPFTGAVHALLKVFPRAPKARRGWSALGALAALGPHAASAVPHLIPMLTGKDPRRHYVAAFVLGEIGPPAAPALEPLCEQLLAAWREDQWDHAVATALVLIGDERAVPVLASAAKPLAADGHCLNQWIQVGFDDRGEEASGAVPVLMAMLDAPPFEDNRYYILCWIRNFHAPGDPVPENISGLQRALYDSRPEICGEAALTAGCLGKAVGRLLPDVLAAHAAGRLPESDCPFAEIIAGLQGNPTPLVEWRKERNKHFRRMYQWREHHRWEHWAPKQGTGTFAKAVPPLLRVVLQGSEEEKSRALHALAAIGPDVAPSVPLLVELLRRAETAAMCDDLADVLGAIGPEAEEAISALKELLLERHPAGDWQSADHAVRALNNIGSPQAIAVLIEALDGPDTGRLRYSIAGYLGYFREKAIAAIPKLEELLKLPDHPWGRAETIAEAIEMIDPTRRK